MSRSNHTIPSITKHLKQKRILILESHAVTTTAERYNVQDNPRQLSSEININQELKVQITDPLYMK